MFLRKRTNEELSYYDWLLLPEPDWKYNLDRCHPSVLRELNMSQEEIEKILIVLDENGIFDEVSR